MVNFENRQTWVFPLKAKRKRVLLSSTPNGSVTPVTGIKPTTILNAYIIIIEINITHTLSTNDDASKLILVNILII